MRVSASEVSFAAAHARRDLVERRLEIRVAQPAPPADQLTLSPAATAPVEPIDFEGNLTPALGLVKLILEKLLGCTIRLGAGSPRAAPASPGAAPTQSSRASPEIEIRASEHIESEEHLRVAAQGAVLTQDGRRIEFELAIALDRSRVEDVELDLRTGKRAPQRKDPLVLNLGATAAQPSGTRFEFDLDADGAAEQVPALASGSLFLALDANGNGKIDDGRELFGTRSGDGFADLARHDMDGNGWIDEADPAWSKLRVWQPGSAPQALDAADVGAIALGHVASAYEYRDGDDRPVAALRDTGVFLRESGAAGTVQQLDLFV